MGSVVKVVISYGASGLVDWDGFDADVESAIDPVLLKPDSVDNPQWQRGNTVAFNTYGGGSLVQMLVDRLLAISSGRFFQVFVTMEEHGVMYTIEIVDGAIEHQREYLFSYG